MKKIWNSQNWNSWENSRQRLQLAKRIFVILFSSFLLIYGVFLFPCYSLQFVADLLWILPEIKSYPYSGIPLACSRTFIVIQSFIRKHSINSLYGIIHEYHVSLVQYTLTKVNGILRRNNSTINVRDFCCFYFHLCYYTYWLTFCQFSRLAKMNLSKKNKSWRYTFKLCVKSNELLYRSTCSLQYNSIQCYLYLCELCWMISQIFGSMPSNSHLMYSI